MCIGKARSRYRHNMRCDKSRMQSNDDIYETFKMSTWFIEYSDVTPDVE